LALFGKGEKEKPGQDKGPSGAVPVVGRKAFCRICDDYRQFSRCWLRPKHVTQCPECGVRFENVPALYAKFQPACPRCGAFLEQPGFEYGLCDGCGSRYELVPGTKPGLLPNQRQRAEMDKHGKVWRIE
jgi:hypothetical protein